MEKPALLAAPVGSLPVSMSATGWPSGPRSENSKPRNVCVEAAETVTTPSDETPATETRTSAKALPGGAAGDGEAQLLGESPAAARGGDGIARAVQQHELHA